MSAKKILDHHIPEIIDLHNSGLSTTKIGKIYNCSHTTISNKLIKAGVQTNNYTKYMVNEVFFDELNSEEKLYILGFLFADGYVSKKQYQITIALALKDEYILHIFQNYLCLDTNNHIKYVTHHLKSTDKDYHIARFSIYSKKIHSQLNNYGLTPTKSLNCLFPSIVKNLDSNLIAHFIRGYFDGDGCIYKSIPKNTRHSPSYSIQICVTKEFGESIKEILEKEIDINCHVRINKTNNKDGKKNIYILEFGGNQQTKQFCDWIYKDSHIFLYRKHNRYLELCSLLKTIYSDYEEPHIAEETSDTNEIFSEDESLSLCTTNQEISCIDDSSLLESHT